MSNRALAIIVAVVIQCACVSAATQVVLLGTGTPAIDPDRSGPATAIVVGDTAYLIDFGPGVVRRAAAAAAKGISAVRPENLKTAFVTHLHSDHTVGYPDLIFTPWVIARKDALNVYGPKGLQAMTDHILAAWQEDIDVRTKGLEQRWPLRVVAHEIKPGIVYTDALVRVTAFLVPHGQWDEAYGYRFDAPDRVIVISGDTRPSPELVKACRRCDILIHEVYPMGSRATMPDWPKYRAQYHTSTQELAQIASQSQPGLLIVYHRTGGLTNFSDEQYLKEIGQGYSGKVVIGHDLEVY
ncbi:MAG TPA: MBL fold metallo-hydrolase [Bryobacteraceae bacterium]|jgi:ribonuclease BN (tRNA processing enzyme)|nr:MBL fold metallo-hydrolase [Bryobacteraceae bacterium]